MSYPVNCKVGDVLLSVGWYVVRPEVWVLRFRARRGRRQLRDGPVERDPDPSAEAAAALKDGSKLAAFVDHGSDPAATFGSQIADLHAARAEHRHRPAIGWVFRLASQVYWIARRAKRNLEPPARSTSVREIGTHDRQ
jgi:hypothetical protein